MRMSEGLNTCKDKVLSMLSQYEETRDSDKLLWLAYLCKYHGLKETLGLENYLKLKKLIMHEDTPTMETVRRIRQKIQEAGSFIGKNRAQRMEEAEIVRTTI